MEKVFEGLRQELERERIARLRAEAESERLRDDARRSDLALRLMHSRAEQERTARVIAEAEAERLRIQASNSDRECQMWSLYAQQNEAEVAALRREIEDTYNAQQTKERDETDERYHRSLESQSDQNSEDHASKLSFPYSTKELEVMRIVALNHWAGHTPDKRQPKQETIQRAICNELGLDVPTDKTPPNKAIYLAMAIKPDGLPRA